MRESQRGNEKSNTQQLTGFEPKTCQISERHAARFYYNHCDITPAALIVTAFETLQTFVIKIFLNGFADFKKKSETQRHRTSFLSVKKTFLLLEAGR